MHFGQRLSKNCVPKLDRSRCRDCRQPMPDDTKPAYLKVARCNECGRTYMSELAKRRAKSAQPTPKSQDEHAREEQAALDRVAKLASAGKPRARPYKNVRKDPASNNPDLWNKILFGTPKR